MPFQPRPELVKGLQAIAERLFERTKPARVTIRVDTTNDPDYPVIGEARAPGVSSLTGGISLAGYKTYDIHSAPTVGVLRDERRMIVQRDVRVDPPEIPQLLDLYGCLSQILAPLDWQGRFVGVISVHDIDPRDWAEADKGAVKDAVAEAERELQQAAWFDLPR